ncbi:MAG: hypothetical protein Fur0022_12950 [Anaerolineales bacterium]
MKIRLVFFLAVWGLAACSNPATPIPTATPNISATDTANQIGTVVAARATEAAIEAAYTPTPTPEPVAMADLILTSAEANELANRWAGAPFDDTASVSPELCKLECVLMNWQGGPTGVSYLEIMLVKTNSREEASTFVYELQNNVISAGTALEVALPELVALPEGTIALDARTGDPSVWGLFTRHGPIAISIAINMPDLSEDENLLFLSLYADRQIQKLIAAGY